MHFDNEWLLAFEVTAGVRLRALFEKDLEGMPLEIADGLRRLREAEEKAAYARKISSHAKLSHPKIAGPRSSSISLRQCGRISQTRSSSRRCVRGPLGLFCLCKALRKLGYARPGAR